jgi:serine/threonine protein kinase
VLQEMVGHYQVVARLGAGGMGTVYRALDTRLKRYVALKAIHPRHMADPGAAARLKKEALAAASLDHPYICKVYELLEDGPRTLLVMEHVEGETLDRRLAAGPLSLEETLRYGVEIAEALVEAHSKGVIHRDVKPSNIIVTPHEHVKVMDFGIASVMAGSPEAETTTGIEDDRAGTPRYMAPEQAAGQKVDARADIFSLGVVLYECLAGRPPFDGDSTRAYLANLGRKPTPLRTLRDEVPRDVERAILRCIEWDPRKRFQSDVDLLATLTELRGDTQNPPEVIPRPRPAWLRPVALVALVAACAAGAWLAWARFRRPPEPVFEAGQYVQLTTSAEDHGSRISPDAQWISYLSTAAGDSAIWQKPLNNFAARAVPVPTPPGVITSHAWSPDSSDIAYLRAAQGVLRLEVIPRTGSPEPVVSWSTDFAAPTTRLVRWVGNDIYVESTPGRLFRFDARTGAREPVTLPPEVAAGRARDFDLSLDGGAVVLSLTAKEMHRDLWCVDLKTRRAIQLTSGDYTNENPIWLGRTRRIAFRSNREGQTDLWTMSIDDRAPARLTMGAGDEVPEDASDDGSVLTFGLRDERSRLWRLPAGTLQFVEMTRASVNETWPSAATRANLLAFERLEPLQSLGWSVLDTEIHLLAAGAGGDSQRVTRGYAPLLSPDGASLAFLRQPAARALETELWLRDGEKQESLVSDRFANPGVFTAPGPLEPTAVNLAWTRDSSALVFVEAGNDANRLVLFRPPAAGGSKTTLAERPGGRIQDVRPSHDGRLVAFASRGESDPLRWEIAVHDLEAGSQRPWWTSRLSPPEYVRLIGWGEPDSRLVMLKRVRNDDGTDRVEIDTLDGPGAVPRRLADLARAYAATARVDPAGRWLYWLTADRDANRLLKIKTDGSGSPLEVRRTPRRSVVLEGMTFGESGDLVLAQREETQVIYGIWFRRER